MLTASMIRGLLLILIGILLYTSLVYAIEVGERTRLRKKNHKSNSNIKVTKFQVEFIYILTLISGTVILFRLITLLYKSG